MQELFDFDCAIVNCSQPLLKQESNCSCCNFLFVQESKFFSGIGWWVYWFYGIATLIGLFDVKVNGFFLGKNLCSFQ